jgi:hypothetical protein
MLARFALIFCMFSFTYMLNIPFGMLRARARKFSLKWFLYIHLPIPFIFLARVMSNLDYRYIPIFVFAAIIGQLMGGKMEF